MTRMIEITRSYSDIAAILQQQGDLRRNSLQQLVASNRHIGLIVRKQDHACA